MKLFQKIVVGLLLFPAACLWSQVDNAPTQPAITNNADTLGNNPNNNDSRMLTPPPVSGQEYPTTFADGERSNYVSGGIVFTSAYTDNVLGSFIGRPISDVSYSVAPFIELDETTSRRRWALHYAPGPTFYQRLSGRNETDENASIDLQYRLSPHMTFSARDGFQKSSNVFNQTGLQAAAAVSGGTQQPNSSVVPPIADHLSNVGNVGLSYQFAANGMVGAGATFSNLHYPNPAEVPGLFDSDSQGGSVFYSLRISKMHYVGTTYQYERLMTYPTAGQNETQTHAILFFYTLYAASGVSISFFGGPQHSDTMQPPLPPLHLYLPAARTWTPAAGGSMSWQGHFTNVALSYSHIISGGGGLVGAVKMDNASASIQQQLARRLIVSLSGGYTQNEVLGSVLAGATNGHTVSGTASVRHDFGPNVSVQLGYARLHQDYSGVAVLATTPNTNREYISISYQFTRPLGR